MDIIRIMAKQFARIRQTMRKRRGVLTALACFVVFVTTYSLILPAITLDEDSAGDQSGINTRTEQQAEEQDQGKNSQADNQNAGSEKTGNEKESASDDQKAEKPDITNAEENSIDKNADAEKEEETAGEERDKEEAGSEDTEAAAQTAKELEYEGDDYTITVKSGKAAGIPEGAELSVKEIQSDTSSYGRYLRKAEKRLSKTGQTLSSARFFDIEILDSKGTKIEPDSPVKVEITYDDAVDMEKGESLKVVHFADEGTELITDVDVSKNKKEISYVQDSFSVTGTIVGRPSNGQQRMIVLKDGNRYYIVNNDATLTEVGYDEAENAVSVVEPMLWTFEENNIGENNIYFNSEASGFNANQTASDWFRRYLDPSSDSGTTEEVRSGTDAASLPGNIGVTVTSTGSWFNQNDHNNEVEINRITNRQNAKSTTSVTIDTAGGTSTIRHGSTYFGIERAADGTPVKLVPQTGETERAQFIFAEASKVPSGVHLQNAVNHIDISIEGDTSVTVPLAYGTYYKEDGTPVEITEDTSVVLHKQHATDPEALKITSEDMKRATITAYDKDGNELDDAFYITGFSQNASTSLSTPQVRIEGSFKVAQPEKDNPEFKTIDGTRYDGNWWAWQMPDNNYVNAVRRARLNNIIDYKLTVVKPVTYQLVDENGDPLYIDEDKTPLLVSVDVAFSGTFNYWDHGKTEKNSGNECPPLENNQAWLQGDIPNHDMSGMDFVLYGTSDEQHSPLVALEIVKRVVDEKGNLITLGEPVTNKVSIYENKRGERNAVKDYKMDPINGVNPDRDNDEGLFDGYTHLRDREITVKEGSSQALIFDYNVTSGMYYIEESDSEADLPETITDNKGQEWHYVKSYIKTEYVKRGYKDNGGNDDFYDKNDENADPMHLSDDYYRGDDYRSSPEVLGPFKPVTGNVKKSTFLEYFVYNVYSKGKTLDVEKQWLPADGKVPEGAEVKVDLYYAKGENGQFPDKSEYEKVVAGQGPFAQNLKTTATLKDENHWKYSFEDLPETVEEGNKVYDLDYFVKETSVKVGDIDITKAYKASTEIQNGKAIIKNEREQVELDAEKKWAEGTDIPDGTQVTFGLRFASRKAVEADGTVIPAAERTEWPAKGSYVPVKTGSGYAAVFVNDPGVDETKIETELTLSSEDASAGVWKGVFKALPKYLIAEDGSIYEVDYYAEETAVKVPAAGRTVIDDDASDVIDDYFVTSEKTDSEDENSDGKVTVTNEYNSTELDVVKTWAKGVEVPSGTEVKAGLRFAARMITKNSGEAVTPAPWPAKKDYKEVAHGSEDSITVSGSGTEREATGLTVKAAAELTLKANAGNPEKSWKDSFKDLPKYIRDEDGNTWELDYHAAETAVNVPDGSGGTKNEISKYIHTEDKTEGTVTITNKEKTVVTVKKTWDPAEPPAGGEATVQLKRYKVAQTPDQIRTSATVVKVWDDADDQDGKRPDSLSVTLTGGNVNRTVTLNDSNEWKATVDDLQAYDADGDHIEYTWTESLPEGTEYSLKNTTTHNGVTTLTNSYTPGKTSATVRIDWQDGDNRDGYRPNAVTVKLDQNGQKVTLSDDNDWTATITGLPEYSHGEKVNYTWTADSWTAGDDSRYTWEGAPQNAVSEPEADTQSKITYTHEPEMTTKKVRIVWDDGDDADHIRPENVVVRISEDTSKQVTLTGDSWTGSTELFANRDGEPAEYTWENPIISGYTLTSEGEDPDGTKVLTYRHEPKPPRDYVTVTIHTVQREARDGYYINWETNGWHTNIYNLNAHFNGEAVNLDSGWRDQSTILKAPLTFNMDKNTGASFHIDAGGTDVSLVNAGANGTQLTQSGEGNSRDISFTAGTDDIDIYIVLTGYEQKLPEYSKVYMVVSESGPYSVAKDPTNAVKQITVPVNTDVAFNYDSYYYAPWTQNIEPKYTVYYYHDTQYEHKWEPVSPPLSGEVPDEDVVFNVGMKERYLILLNANPQFSSNFNCQLESLASGSNSSSSPNAAPAASGLRSAKTLSSPALSSGGITDASDAADIRGMLTGKNVPSMVRKAPSDISSGNGTGDQSGTSGQTANVIMSSPVEAPEGYTMADYVKDTDFDTPPVTLTLKDGEGFGWEQSFPEQEKYDKWGRPYIYYVDEIDFKPADYATESITGDPNKGQTVQIVNRKSVEYGSVKVTKAFAGIDSLPDGFKITAAYEEDGEQKTVELTTGTAGMSGTGTSSDPYTWIINNIPAGTVVTFTETGYSENGYSVTVNGKAQAAEETATASSTDSAENTAAFVNAYTKNPGDLELTKKVSGQGADSSKQFSFTIELTPPEGIALNSSYGAVHSGDPGVSSVSVSDGKVTGIKLKDGEVFTIKDLPAGTGYSIKEADYTQEGYTPSVTGGSLTGTITGGTTARESAEVTNAYSAVDITVKKVDAEKAEGTAGRLLSGAQFTLYRFDTEGNRFVAYPDGEKTTGDNGTLKYEKLPNGRYMIAETRPPAGYVKNEDVKMYFTVSENSTVTWTDESGAAIGSEKPDLIDYESQTFTVGNEPGRELPHTGGSGSRVFYILGALLTAAALSIAVLRRRRAKA